MSSDHLESDDLDYLCHLQDFKDFVTYIGTSGKCVKCERFPVPTAEIDSQMTCYSCLSDFDLEKYKYTTLDVKFKCPASACCATELSIREFWLGTCCDDASRWEASIGREVLCGMLQEF